LESIVITWRELLVVVAIILAVYIAELLLLTRSGGASLRKPRLLGAIRQKREESALRKEVAELQKRIAALEEHLGQPMEAAAPASPPSPYLRAIQMAKQGHDAESVSSSCGISRSEAELIIAMHGRQADSASI